MMMSLNQTIFLALNAPADPPVWLVNLVSLLANSPVIVAPALVASLWFCGRSMRRVGLVATSAAVFVGQGANLAIGTIINDPRPFMVPIGHTLVAHAADNGFPSDHVTLCWTLGLTLIFTSAAPRWGAAMLIYGLAVAWSRIWLGIHFPMDMLGSAFVAPIVAGIAALACGWLERFRPTRSRIGAFLWPP